MEDRRLPSPGAQLGLGQVQHRERLPVTLLVLDAVRTQLTEQLASLLLALLLQRAHELPPTQLSPSAWRHRGGRVRLFIVRRGTLTLKSTLTPCAALDPAAVATARSAAQEVIERVLPRAVRTLLRRRRLGLVRRSRHDRSRRAVLPLLNLGGDER